MHSGFTNLRSALPMNLKAHYPGFKVWAGAQADIDRIATIWRECLTQSGGPFLFGETPRMADAMYAPVCTRFTTYDVKLDSACAAYCKTIMALPLMQEWIEAAQDRARRAGRTRRRVLDAGFNAACVRRPLPLRERATAEASAKQAGWGTLSRKVTLTPRLMRCDTLSRKGKGEKRGSCAVSLVVELRA